MLASTNASAQVSATTSPTDSQSATTDLSIASFDPENAVAPISIVQGPGVKVGEGTVLHPTVGIETGFVSNVFYQSIDPAAAGFLRVMAQVGTASLSQDRLNPSNPGEEDETQVQDKGQLQYQANVRLAYDQPLSSNSAVTSQGGLGIGLLLRGLANPNGTFAFGFDENFIRMIRAPNFEISTTENRDVNVVRLSLHYQPPGHAISGYLYYQNTIDAFEESFNQYPDRIDHRIGLHPQWQWLPQTTVYGDVSLGFVSGIGSSTVSMMKASSMPLSARVGIATLLTAKITANLDAGYTNGFYSSGPSFSAPLIDAMVAYRFSPLGRVGLAYDLLYADSVNANFYRDHEIRAFFQQGFAPFVVMVQPELHFREYQGITVVNGGPVRDDVIFAAVAGIHYNFRNWIAATLDYRFSDVSTDYRYTDNAGRPVDPSYVRHDLLVGMRVAM